MKLEAAKDFISMCKFCGKDDAWEGEETIWRVNGKEGNKPELLLLVACSCGVTYTFPTE
jgi:hypothetical protein